ncbi:hypothetical protein VXI66_004484 [Salmonella enterica]|nr:hypothetical protein [Salmonella enterica subsp. enterica]ELM8410735.1 hypothetical protein [Salmonella enterica subsp. enterica serovar Enteritidis]EME0524717.1 hypothetical protein [Salmonella enterica]
MSLATDILKHAGINLAPPSSAVTKKVTRPKAKVKRKPKPRVKPVNEMPDVYPRIPGVHQPKYCAGKGLWRAHSYDGKKVVNLGEFSSQARAHMAVKLYKLWRKRGYSDIPHKPSIRLYTFR